MSFYCMKDVNLLHNTIKILGVHFSCNKKTAKRKENSEEISRIVNQLS